MPYVPALPDEYNDEEGQYYGMDGGDGYEADAQIFAAMSEWQEPRNNPYDVDPTPAMARRMPNMSNNPPHSDSSDTGILFHMGGVASGRQAMATISRGRDGFHRQNDGRQTGNLTSYKQSQNEAQITARQAQHQPPGRAPPTQHHNGPPQRGPPPTRAPREMQRSVQSNQVCLLNLLVLMLTSLPTPAPALFAGKSFAGGRGPLQSLNLPVMWKEAYAAVKAKHNGKRIEVDYILNGELGKHSPLTDVQSSTRTAPPLAS